MQAMQQLRSAIPGAVQRLQRSVQCGGSAEQQATLIELLSVAEHACDTAPDASILMLLLQHPGLLPALKQLLEAADVQRSALVPNAAMSLLGKLMHAGPQAAEQITA
jgi:hypothetical protein